MPQGWALPVVAVGHVTFGDKCRLFHGAIWRLLQHAKGWAYGTSLGAAVVTAVYTLIASYALGTTGPALAGVGASLSSIAGLLAAFHTRRLVRRYRSTGQRQAS
jgi:hypothetical protein